MVFPDCAQGLDSFPPMINSDFYCDRDSYSCFWKMNTTDDHDVSFYYYCHHHHHHYHHHSHDPYRDASFFSSYAPYPSPSSVPPPPSYAHNHNPPANSRSN